MNAAGKTEKEALEIDSTKSPKHIDLVPLDGPDKGKRQMGLYELSGDVLKVALGEPGQARPPALRTKPGDKFFVVNFRRATSGSGPAPQARGGEGLHLQGRALRRSLPGGHPNARELARD